MPPAIIAGGIAAVGAIGGAVIGSNAQKSAANQATQATTAANNQATAAQLQLGNASLDLQRQMYNNGVGLQTDIYNQGFNILSPYAANGMVASDSLNALLGLPKGTPIQSTVHAPPPITGPSGTTPITTTPGTTPATGAPTWANVPQTLAAGSMNPPAQTAPVASQTPVNALSPTPAPPLPSIWQYNPQTGTTGLSPSAVPANPALQAHAQAAIAAGADPAAVQARMASMMGGSQ